MKGRIRSLRHSRAGAFAAALARRNDADGAPHWSTATSDPNDPKALVLRSKVLADAWRPPVTSRVDFLADRCRGQRVLDIGCVAHDIARWDQTQWLHARLAEAADTCVGVDIHAEGIAEMRRRGFDAVAHDLTDGLGPLRDHAPFDVIMAGELIEHVEHVGMLFDTAAQALAPTGELIITSPNPWAPHRVRAAQLGIVWENADHILLAFPSGIAELASRHGLVLAEARTTAARPQRRQGTGLSLVEALKQMRRRIKGRQWMTVGFDSLETGQVSRVEYGPIGAALRGMWWPQRRFLGETFIYVVRRTHD